MRAAFVLPEGKLWCILTKSPFSVNRLIRKKTCINPKINLLAWHPRIHVRWLSLPLIIPRYFSSQSPFALPRFWSSECKRNWLATNTSTWKALANVYSKMSKKPIRWNSAMSGHTRSSSGSSPFINSTLFSGATCAAHETRLHSGRSASWSIAGQPKMAHPANQLGMRCNVPVCKTCPGAGKDWDYNSDIETTD